jgi:uncharacterized protein
MRSIYEVSDRAVELVSEEKIRPQMAWLTGKDRLIGIKGSRGVGKTTILLQYAKRELQEEKYVYVSLDNLYFTEHTLTDFADDFYKNGGKFILIDEVHHYPNWSIELKNIYDAYPDLRIIYTGSSLLQLTKGRTDLSRRAVVYDLPGLSLREFINYSENLNFPVYQLEKILANHTSIARSILKQIRPVQLYSNYINYGYYPFFLEGTKTYHKKLNEIILHVFEADLPLTTGMNYSNINKLKQLLYVISESSPFKPNIERLSERIGLARNTLKEYLHYMAEAQIINMLFADNRGISRLTKPDKIYLQNPNLMVALTAETTNPGNLREAFFLNQVNTVHNVNYSRTGDFIVDNKTIFEIGGKSKSPRQIAGLKNAFLALDGIETGYKNEIPLWLFGFLY